MPSRASQALGAGCLLLAGCSLAPATASAVEGAGRPHAAVSGTDVASPSGRRRDATRSVGQTAPTPGATTEPEAPGGVTTAWTKTEPAERSCFRARRKLWQGDEGWVVKSVKVCP